MPVPLGPGICAAFLRENEKKVEAVYQTTAMGAGRVAKRRETNNVCYKLNCFIGVDKVIWISVAKTDWIDRVIRTHNGPMSVKSEPKLPRRSLTFPISQPSCHEMPWDLKSLSGHRPPAPVSVDLIKSTNRGQKLVQQTRRKSAKRILQTSALHTI